MVAHITTIPAGYCQCGCGSKTEPYKHTNTAKNQIRGQFARRLIGHGACKTPQPLPEEPNPSGLCMCGCGRKTELAPQTKRYGGWIKGKPIRYLDSHQARPGTPQYSVDDETRCWNWNWGKTPRGYGSLQYGGRLQPAYRVFYQERYGAIPKGIELHHTCGNTSCVNPEHLQPVSHMEHMRKSRNCKLTIVKAREIRRLFASGVNRRKLAERFSVAWPTIARIVNGTGWVE